MRAARTLLAVLGMVAIGAATPVAAQTAPPSPLPLPEIGRTHSKGLCTTVRDRVAPAVLGLMKTDELIGAGHRALIKSGKDEIQPPVPSGVDGMRSISTPPISSASCRRWHTTCG